MVVHGGTLKGAFKGFRDRETVFEFTDGQRWRQNEYKYHYHYAYRPDAKILQKGSTYFIEVEGVDESVEVIQIR